MAEFSNPNQQGGGGQDNKSLLAMLVVFLIALVGIQVYHAKTAPQTAPASTSTAPASAAPASATAAQPSAAASSTANVAASATQQPKVTASPAAPSVPVVQAGAESTTVVENELYRITFSNRGAQVTSWVLKKFNDANGKPLDLVNAQAAKLFGYPLSLYTQDGTTVSLLGASRKSGVVTLITAGNVPVGMNGRAVAISGIADATYDGTYTVTQTAPNALSYRQDYGDDGSSTGGTLTTLNGATGEMLSQALFVPSATGVLTAPATLTFKYSNGDLQTTKTFRFDASYVLHAEVQTTRGGALLPALLSWPGGFGDQNEDPRYGGYTNSQFDSDRNGSAEHLAPKKITGGAVLSGPFDWAGVSDVFFAAVFLPDAPGTAEMATLNANLDASKTIKRVGFNASSPPTKALEMPILGAALGDISGPIETRIFVGPKAINVLKSVHAADATVTLGPDLEFGYFGFVGKYLFLALQAIHSLIAGWAGSWGWAIVILTVLINLLVLPFRVKGMVSALKLQRLQPQIDAIKLKYKNPKMNDPKYNQMQQEVMDFQKAQGVNMFGGCIPNLITFPLLIAFYTMLLRVVELRHAHWFWLPDLQAADPLHILPIFMFVSMFLVQFYTPSPGIDPKQQRMMAFMMPAFSLYWTWTYASGLALYWAVGNVISIAQQAVMNRTSLGKEMREIAAKRARRKGNTIQGKR